MEEGRKDQAVRRPAVPAFKLMEPGCVIVADSLFGLVITVVPVAQNIFLIVSDVERDLRWEHLS